jgi:hypothetical protein
VHVVLERRDQRARGLDAVRRLLARRSDLFLGERLPLQPLELRGGTGIVMRWFQVASAPG